MGFEPMNNGFAGRRVSHFATRAHCCLKHETHCSSSGFDRNFDSENLSIKPGRQNKPMRNSNTC
jgi:hypothetical protein